MGVHIRAIIWKSLQPPLSTEACKRSFQYVILQPKLKIYALKLPHSKARMKTSVVSHLGAYVAPANLWIDATAAGKRPFRMESE